MMRLFFSPTLLLFSFVAPAGAWAAGSLDISCANRAVEVCASFDGRVVWISRNGGHTWRQLADLAALEENDPSLGVGEDEPSRAEQDSWTLDEETWMEEGFADESETLLDGEIELSESPLDEGPQGEMRVYGRGLCVSDSGVVALALGSRIHLLVGARQRLIRVPAAMRSCVFDEEEILWLSGPEATIRLDPLSGSWGYAQPKSAMAPVRAPRGVFGPFRSSARREFRSCPVRAAIFFPRVRLMFALQRYERAFVESGGTMLSGKDWGVDFALWLDFHLPGSGPPHCLVEASPGQNPNRHSLERPAPFRPPNDSSLAQTLDFWERVEARRALSAALGDGEFP